jgi:hypothetical protein
MGGRDKAKIIPDQSPQPTILQVRMESREEGLRCYSKVLKKCSPSCPSGTFHTDGLYSERKIVYVNFAVDRFHRGHDLNLIIGNVRWTFNFDPAALEQI